MYVAAARMGLALDAVAGFATLVWPPTGIAVAVLLLFGSDMWPGIAIGAFVANLWTGAPPAVALGIAAGNTAEALLATHLLHRVPRFELSLERIVDVFALVGLAGMVSTVASATIGVLSLYLGGIVTSDTAAETWAAWWAGDLMGVVLVSPFILVWASNHRLAASRARRIEAVALMVVIVAVGLMTFRVHVPVAPGAIVPALIWAALRFGPRGAATASFTVAAIAIWATSIGVGPFVRPQLRESLVALQTFMGIVATTFLVLSASFSERKEAETEARAAQGRADSANRAKSDFLATMSHELRTPLNAIAGYVELTLLGLNGPITDKQKDALERVQRNNQHLTSLIEDVLVFAKDDVTHLAVRTEPVNVVEAIDDAEAVIAHAVRGKNLEFSRELFPNDLRVRADRDRVRQVLANLLSNAAKYTEEGGTIRIGAARHQDVVRIWIKDTGIGIPADQLGRVFEPFFQVETGNARRHPGIGLGLTIARDLARAMKGDVTIESVEHEGTTATLTLPAQLDPDPLSST